MTTAWTASLSFCIAATLLALACLLMWDKGWLKIDPADPWGWMQSAEFTAQMAHVGWSCWIVLFAAHWLGPWWPAVAMVVYASAKEFVFDVLPKPYGEGATWFGSLIDFLFYGVGTSGAVTLFYLERLP